MDSLWLSRLSLLTAICLLLAFGKPQQRLIRYFEETDSAANLALFRIAVFLALAVEVYFRRERLLFLVGLPEELRRYPIGAGFWRALPLDRTTLTTGLWLLEAVAVAGALGIAGRACAGISAVLIFLLLGVGNWFAKLDHSVHFLWFTVILALSPCTDCWAVDAWRAGKQQPLQKGRRYALPLRWALLIVGGIYFVSGFWKVWQGGWSWALGDTLRNYLWRSWYELGGWQPGWRIDRYPTFYRLLGLFTILFELGFVVATLSRKWRRSALAAAVFFHVGVWLLMRAHFLDLALLEVALLGWFGSREVSVALPENYSGFYFGRRAPLPTLNWFATVLVLGNLAVGIASTDYFWPITHYPTFRDAVDDVFPVAKFEIAQGDGEFHALDESKIRACLWSSNTWRNINNRVLRMDDESHKLRLMRLLWQEVAKANLLTQPGTRLRVYSVEQRVNPDALQEVERGPTLEISLARSGR